MDLGGDVRVDVHTLKSGEKESLPKEKKGGPHGQVGDRKSVESRSTSLLRHQEVKGGIYEEQGSRSLERKGVHD